MSRAKRPDTTHFFPAKKFQKNIDKPKRFGKLIPEQKQKGTKMKTTKNTQLESAVEWLRSLDPVELVGEFRQLQAESTWGTYCALILDPAERRVRFVNEPSWSCSQEEYFGTNGVLSERTVLSGNAWEKPGPDGGFEWDYCQDGQYAHAPGNPGAWTEWTESTPKDWERFDVSTRPVDGWVPKGWGDHEVKELMADMADMADKIEAEIED